MKIQLLTSFGHSTSNHFISFQVNAEGDAFGLQCNPKVNCLNTCEWTLPDKTTCSIDANTQYNDYICTRGRVRYIGEKIANCQTGNCIRSCDIEVEDASKDLDVGMWTCATSVKIASGHYVDNVNVTFYECKLICKNNNK